MTPTLFLLMLALTIVDNGYAKTRWSQENGQIQHGHENGTVNLKSLDLSKRRLRAWNIINEKFASKRTARSVVNIGIVGGLKPMGWSHTEWFGDGDIALQWKSAGGAAIFKAEAKAEGHVAFAIGNDAVLAWFDMEGQPQILDCHLNSGIPVADEIQDYELVFGVRNHTHLVIEFRRLLDTCDPDDVVITSDALDVQWTLGRGDPRASGWRGWLGSRSLRFLNPKAHIPETTQASAYKKWEVVLNNFEISESMATIFWCKMFKVPNLDKKHHIIGYRPAGKSGTARHAVLYECSVEAGADGGRWDNWATTEGYLAVDMPREWSSCISPVAAWAIGSKGEMFPEHVGIPFGDPKGTTYYMLEIHFENPTLERVTDSSGLTILYTSDLRPHDAGVIVSGITVSPLHVLPAEQPRYRSAGYCATPCTTAMFPKDGINIVSVLLHAHSAGRKLSLRHIRNGQELPKLAEDDHYDYKNQQSRVLLEERNVLPSDELITECTYDTRGRPRPTLGGYSSKQEMCLAFILHYPRTQLAGCYSMTPIKEFFEIFGVREFYGSEMKDVENMFLSSGTLEGFPDPPETGTSNKTPKDVGIQGDDQGVSLLGQLVIKEPFEFRNKSFIAHLNEIPWSEQLLTKRIEDTLYKGKHMTFCRKRDDTLAVPIEIHLFPKFNEVMGGESTKQCQYKSQQNNSTSSTEKVKSNKFTIILTTFVLFTCKYY